MKINKAEILKDNGKVVCIEIDDDGIKRCVPECEDNRHYQELKRLEKEGKIEIKDRA